MQLIPNASCFETVQELLATRDVTFNPDPLNIYLADGKVLIQKLDQDTVIPIYDLEHFKEISAFNEQSKNYKKLRDAVRGLKEKCKAPTTQMCIDCPAEDGRVCLMKPFHFIERSYKPSPHHGREYGDIYFETKLNGVQRTIKVIMKSYSKTKSEVRTVTATTKEGGEILRQVVTQYLSDPSLPILTIIAPPKLDGQLRNDIIRLVKFHKGQVCFIEELELVQIINLAMAQGLTGFSLN